MLLQPITNHMKMVHYSFHKAASKSRKITVITLLSTIAAILQAAGGWIPVVGLFISPFATAPVVISMVLSARYGLLGFVITLFLLALIQPSEVIIFAFTTGLLGIGIGIACYLWKRRLSLIMTGAVFLLGGILIVLLVFRFPLLGPFGGSLLPLAVFSFLYSWIWVELTVVMFKRLQGIVGITR